MKFQLFLFVFVCCGFCSYAQDYRLSGEGGLRMCISEGGIDSDEHVSLIFDVECDSRKELVFLTGSLFSDKEAPGLLLHPEQEFLAIKSGGGIVSSLVGFNSQIGGRDYVMVNRFGRMVCVQTRVSLYLPGVRRLIEDVLKFTDGEVECEARIGIRTYLHDSVRGCMVEDKLLLSEPIWFVVSKERAKLVAYSNFGLRLPIAIEGVGKFQEP